MKKVIIYVNNSCRSCKLAKDYLNKKNVKFEERNVSRNKNYKQELFSKGYIGVPVIIIGKQEINSFNKEKIDALL